MAQYIKGIDVAHWEPEIDWAKVRAREIRYAFIKATQAADYVDDKFLSHWTGAKQAGILRGAYHFIDPRVDGRLQAEHFLRTVKLEPGDLPPVLDLEDLPVTATVIPKAAAGRKTGKEKKGGTGGRLGKGAAVAALAANSQMIACAEVWLRLVEKETDRKPIIYSGPYFLRDRMADSRGAPPSWASKYMLWIANYLNHPVGPNDLPLQPKGWANWTFWQYSESGMVDGIYNKGGTSLTAVDLNFFRGTLEDLYALAGAAMPTGGVEETAPVNVPAEKPQAEVVVPVNVPPEPTVVTGPLTYCIEPGDTLFGLAMRFHTTVEAILAANPQITNPNLIRAGENLTIPQAG